MNRKIDLELTPAEKALLKEQKITQKSLDSYAIDEIIAMLGPAPQREKELVALFEFQTIPSIGIRFARDLIFLNYYQLSELKELDGATLFDVYEKKMGCRIDPCVEDQFRLVIHYANSPGSNKQWWDLTDVRKTYRSQYGYPADRP